MATDIQKPNDMLVSSLVNGNVDVMDLTRSGINAENTQLLDPQTYKESKLIKEKFTDEQGNFRDDIFNQYYEQAAAQYEQLADLNSYAKLADYVEYNAKDLFAPLTSKKAQIGYEIEKEKNPLRQSHGVSHLFDYGDQTKSMRELAQMSKIWDSEKQEWLDKTADERGILGSIFGQSLVYATYDEDTEEIDPNTGKKIKHKKGDWKLNEDGQYYTETIGNRSGYGKQYVAASDTLTKEDSALNKIDFFDSDDVEKSLTGTIVKTAVKTIPYLIPGVNKVYGAITAGTNLLAVLPTFAKMCEGLVLGGNADNETSFTKTMNTWENYFKRYDSSYSDDGMQKNWGAEKMLDQVSDIFAQLYQMRAAASLSKLMTAAPERQAIKTFNDKYLADVMTKGVMSGVNMADEGVRNRIVQTALQNMPEMQELLAKQTKLSKGLGQAYMALISTSDVYQDALEGGYDRRMAGAAGLAAALGQFAIMNYEDKLNLGGWFLDDTVGYSEGANRKAMVEALRPHYDKIKKALDAVQEAGTKEEKANILASTFGKIVHGIKHSGIDFSNGAQYLKNGAREALEEMTEELVMDSTKAVFDVLSWAGVGNPNASFGVAEDFASGSFLERYLQNAVGGFMGGVLFEAQQNVIEPWIDAKLHGKNKQNQPPTELIREIAAGHAGDLKKVLRDLAALDSDVAAVPVDLAGKKIYQSANGKSVTRGELTAWVLDSYIDMLEGYIVSENANLSKEQLLEKAVRDEEAIALLKDAKVDELMTEDFVKLTSEIVAIRQALDKARTDRTEENKKSEKTKEEIDKAQKSSEEKARKDIKLYNDNIDFTVSGWNEGKSVEFLEKLLEQKRAKLNSFLEGKESEEYLEKAVLTANPLIRASFGDFNLQEYTKYKYNVDFDKLNQHKGTFITQDSVTKEWHEWKALTNPHQKFLKLGIPAYKRFMQKYGQSIQDYGTKGYSDVHKQTIAELFHDNNINVGEIFDNEQAYNIIKAMSNSLKAKGLDKQGDVTLGPIFKQDRKTLEAIVKRVLESDERSLSLLLELGLTKESLQEDITAFLEDKLNLITFDDLSGDSLDAVISAKILDVITQKIDTLLETQQDKSVEGVKNYLASKSLLSAGQANSNIDPKSVDKIDISRFIADNITFDVAKESVGFGSTVLSEVLKNSEVIDGEVRLAIAQQALNSMNQILHNEEKDIVAQSKTLAGFQFGRVMFSIKPADLKKLRDAINTKFDNNDVDLNNIIKEWADEVTNKWIDDNEDSINGNQDGKLSADEVFDGKLSEELLNIIRNKFKESKALNLYNSIKSKTISNNTLLDMMRQTDDVLTQGKAAKILDIIAQEEYKLRGANRFEEYMPKGEAKDQLLSAKTALGVLRAILEGMTDSPVGMDNPIAVNSILKRFAEKYKTGTADKYKTIDSSIAQLVSFDLDALESRIDGLLKLEQRAYVNKEAQEQTVKKSYNTKMLEEMHRLVRIKAFTHGTVSIAPQDEELLQHTDPEEALIWFRSKLFENFNKECHTPAEKAAFIKTFIQNLEIKPNDVTREFKPQNLDRELENLNKADVLQFVKAALIADVRDFYADYKKNVVDNPNSSITPLFSQEIDAYYAWAFGQDTPQCLDKNGNLVTVHSFVQQTLKEINPDLLAAPANNELFINGITGSGKTTVVGGIVSTSLKHKKLYFTAPNEKQRVKFFESVKKFHPDSADALESGTIDLLLEKFLTKEGVLELKKQINLAQDKTNHTPAKQQLMPLLDFNTLRKGDNGPYIVGINATELKKYIRPDLTVATLPELIYIDEATQLVLPYHQVLNILAEQYGMQIFALGDNTQMGAAFCSDTQAFHDLFMPTLPKMNVSVRANNSQVGNNNYYGNQRIDYWDYLQVKYAENPSEAVREFNSYIQQNALTYSYYEPENENEFNGYKLVNSLELGSDTVKKILSANRAKNKLPDEPKQKIMIITDLDPKGTPKNPNLQSFLALNGFKEEEDYEFVSYAKVHDLAVQGSEARYVIVDSGAYDQGTVNGEKSRAIHTLLSRAQSGSLMVVDDKTLETLNIINKRDVVTQVDQLPSAQDAKLKARKDTRSKELAKALKNYTPSNPGKLGTAEKDGKVIYLRQNTSLPTVSNSLKKPISENSGTPEDELTYSEEDQKAIVSALNSSGVVVSKEELQAITGISDDNEYYQATGSLREETLNAASGKSVKPDDKTVTRDSIACWLSLNHLNAAKHEYQEGYQRHSDGSHLDLDGLFNPGMSWINPAMATGFEKFRMLMIAALNKASNDTELRGIIKTGIQNSDEIAYFLAQAVPALAQNRGIPVDLKSVSQYRQIYADWFSTAVDVDDKFYVFAKPMEWAVDQPRNITRARQEDAYEDGEPVLYFGIKISNAAIPGTSDEANAFRKQYLNQYITLGTLSKTTTKDGPIDSKELKDLYAKAKTDLKGSNFVAYRLGSSSVYDLNITSTAWIRNTKGYYDGVYQVPFESLAEMHKRGFDVNEDEIYYISNDLVQIPGRSKPIPVGLLTLAYLEKKSTDVLNPGQTEESLNDKLDRLEKLYIDSYTGEFRLAGHYLAFARCVDGRVNQSNLFNRVVFLDAATYDASQVLPDVVFVPTEKDKKKPNWRTKIAKCDPNSQKLLLTALLNRAGAFKQENQSALLKFLIGMRDAVRDTNELITINGISKPKDTIYANDLETLNELIEYVNNKINANEPVSNLDFYKLLKLKNVRLILPAFCQKFLTRVDLSDEYHIKDPITGSDIVGVNDISSATLQLKPTNNFTPIDAKKDLPLSKGCPTFVKGGEKVNVLERLGVHIDGVESSQLGMFKIAWDPDISPKQIGMLGYQIQAPLALIKNIVLDINSNTIETIKTPLEQCGVDENGKDLRFPIDMKNFIDIPYDTDHWHPKEVLAKPLDPNKGYYIDKSAAYAKYVGTTNGNVKGYYIKGKDGKLVMKDKKPEYHELKKGENLPKNTKDQTIVPVYWKNYTGTYGKLNNGMDLNVVDPVTGIQVRPGDFVQVLGHTDRAYYVESVNLNGPSGIAIRLSAATPNGDGNASGTHPKDTMTLFYGEDGKPTTKEIPLSHISAVVKRAIVDEKHIGQDYYQHPEKFTEGDVMENGKYKSLYKTEETFTEMLDAVINGKHINSLHFNTSAEGVPSWYMIRPVNAEQVAADRLLRVPQSVDGTFDIMYEITTPSQLKAKIEEYSRNPNIKGYVIYHMKRHWGEGRTGELTLQILASMDDAIKKAIYSGNVSEYTQHVVLKDSAEVDKRTTGALVTNIASVPYDRNEIPKLEPAPNELLPLITVNGETKLNISELIKRQKELRKAPKILTRSQFLEIWDTQAKVLENDLIYPSSRWVYVRVDDKYYMYPRPEFFFSTTKLADGTRKEYVSTTEGNTKDKYLDFINRGDTPTSTAQYWTNILSGVLIIDYHTHEYFGLIKAPDDVANADEWKQQEAKRRAAAKSVLDFNRRTSQDENMKFEIVSVDFRSKDSTNPFALEHLVVSLKHRAGTDNTVYYVPFTHFIQLIGLRFDFIDSSATGSAKASEEMFVDIQNDLRFLHTAETNRDRELFNLEAIPDDCGYVVGNKERRDSSSTNRALRIFLKDDPGKGCFELVKDDEDGHYSIHFKTNNGDGNWLINESTREERQKLYDALLAAIPQGAKFSTHGGLTLLGYNALVAMENRFAGIIQKVEDRTEGVFMKNNPDLSITIPVYGKLIQNDPVRTVSTEQEQTTAENPLSQPSGNLSTPNANSSIESVDNDELLKNIISSNGYELDSPLGVEKLNFLTKIMYIKNAINELNPDHKIQFNKNFVETVLQNTTSNSKFIYAVLVPLISGSSTTLNLKKNMSLARLVNTLLVMGPDGFSSSTIQTVMATLYNKKLKLINVNLVEDFIKNTLHVDSEQLITC